MSGDDDGIGVSISEEMGDAVTTEGDDSRSSSSSGGGSGGSRGNVYVHGAYGTNQFPPDTECSECSTRAVGVLVLGQKYGDKMGSKGKPLCSTHRDKFKESNEQTWNNTEFKRFTD